jgi:hypothetical protein
MYIVKQIVVKSAVSLFVGLASAIGTQAGLMVWNKFINDKLEESNKQSFKMEEEFA